MLVSHKHPKYVRDGLSLYRVVESKTALRVDEQLLIARACDHLPEFRSAADARWQVKGVVRHWNHAHRRTNEYRARYTVVQAEEGWRIADHEVLEQRRVDDPDSPIEDGK